MREMRKDERDMTDFGDHRVALVSHALTRVMVAVGVAISENLEAGVPADCPQRGEAIAVKRNDPVLVCVRVEVVVEHDPRYPPGRAIPFAQQKCSALATALAANTQSEY